MRTMSNLIIPKVRICNVNNYYEKKGEYNERKSNPRLLRRT